jgi:hypothetical protein
MEAPLCHVRSFVAWIPLEAHVRSPEQWTQGPSLSTRAKVETWSWQSHLINYKLFIGYISASMEVLAPTGPYSLALQSGGK